jgi:hypothetical protein
VTLVTPAVGWAGAGWRYQAPFGLSLSKPLHFTQCSKEGRPFDRLRANGAIQSYQAGSGADPGLKMRRRFQQKLSPISYLPTGRFSLERITLRGSFWTWPERGRPETDGGSTSHCHRGCGGDPSGSKPRKRPAGRLRKKREAQADPTFFGVQRDRSLRAEGSRKGTRRSSNASAGDPKRPVTSVWPFGADQSDPGQWRLVATPAAISLWAPRRRQQLPFPAPPRLPAG